MKVNLGFFVSKFLRLINRPAIRNCQIDSTAKVGTGSNCINVKMGRYSYMGKNNSVSNTQIGAFCSIASYCAIGGNGHDPSLFTTSPVFFEGGNVFHRNFAKLKTPVLDEVVIGNDVWIGEGVFIKSGVTIGNGAVIGAHSVVTKNVPDYSIMAGSPAKLIRMRFPDDKISLLQETRWWEWPDEDLKTNWKQLDLIIKK